jgi:hypothetical protein
VFHQCSSSIATTNANADFVHVVAAVVVLSPEFVQRQQPMEELQIFLDRKAANLSSIAIIPVFMSGLTAKRCDDLEGLYHSQPWPEGLHQLSGQERAESLEKWAAAVKQLSLQPTVVKSEQVGAACMPGVNDAGSCSGPGEGHGRIAINERATNCFYTPSHHKPCMRLLHKTGACAASLHQQQAGYWARAWWATNSCLLQQRQARPPAIASREWRLSISALAPPDGGMCVDWLLILCLPAAKPLRREACGGGGGCGGGAPHRSEAAA